MFPVSQRKEGKSQPPEYLPSLLDGNANTMELGTLPASCKFKFLTTNVTIRTIWLKHCLTLFLVMPLFGSYPVDDIFSLVTCQNCKFRFRTQTADHHIKSKYLFKPTVSFTVLAFIFT